MQAKKEKQNRIEGNLQVQNGNFTRIHNRILEELAKRKLSGYETRIILTLWRKTYGWRKKKDYISFKQFKEMTNLPKSEVSRTLSRLKKRNLVVENHNSNKRIYKFNKHFTTWKELEKSTTVVENYKCSCRKLHKEMEKTTTKKSEDTNKNQSSSVPKETITKETITKEKSPQSIKKVTYKDKHLALAKLLEKFIKENKSDYVFAEGHLDRWANEIRLMEEKDRRDLKKVSVIIGWALNHSFWKTNILSGSKLRKQFDKLEMQYKEAQGGSNKNRQNYRTDRSRKEDKYKEVYEA